MPDLPEPGCYVDGHWGQYGNARAVQVAHDLGWEDAEAADLAARHLATMGPSNEPDLSPEEFERLIACADAAEGWLNDHRTPANHYWGWDDGEFGLYRSWEEDDA